MRYLRLIKKGEMRKLIYIISLVTIISCNNQTKEKNIHPRLTAITETVYASIKVEPSSSYFSQPLHSGIIKEVLVEEGDHVQKGQILFQISVSFP